MKSFFIYSVVIVGLFFISIFSINYLRPAFSDIDKSKNDYSDSFAAISKFNQKNTPIKKTRNISPIYPNTLFADNFTNTYTVEEKGAMTESNNPNWWVSSGAYFFSSEGTGKTVVGELSSINPWRLAFFLSNAKDTDDGYHPQNIFRLVTRGQWKNFEQQGYFKIIENNLSESENRNASNGLLFFNRYQDQFNLYYAGIRVDGYAVIKKKINKEYFTLDYKKVFEGEVYNRDSNPNLIPSNTWIGLKTKIVTISDGSVKIQLFIDKNKTGVWELIAEANDKGSQYGSAPFSGLGFAGIRTDFMDVEFDDYKIQEIN
jgi:hypothetical protein